MEAKDIGRILLYDPIKFELYLNYHEKCDNSHLLSFEEFLLCNENLKKYIENSESIIKEYQDYHQDEPILPHDNYLLFCEALHIFPYDESKLESYRQCSNCIFYCHSKNLITGEEFDSCQGDESLVHYPEYSCDSHIFDTEAIKPVVRSLLK